MKRAKVKKHPERIIAEQTVGLNDEQVRERFQAGLINVASNHNSKSYGKIFFDNVCTSYNLLCLACFIALLSVHTPQTPLSNYVFIVIYLLNIVIGIVQEIRAKRALDKMSFLGTPTATVVRNGKETLIPVSQIVIDDILKLSIGMQIPADCVVVSGEAELDESMLTGESVAVKKTADSQLFSGSFITSGNLLARVVKVGDDCYVNVLSKKAKRFKKTDSELLTTMKKIINVLGIIIIPTAVLSGLINYKHLSATLADFDLVRETVKSTVAVIVGMIPGGMFFLTSLALAVGIIKLSDKHTLVQDMYSLEMLARVNLLCLDKTGTLTNGDLRVVKCINLDQTCAYNTVIANFERVLDDGNNTAKALKEFFKSDDVMKEKGKIPFNSTRKWAAVTFENDKTYVLGATEKMFPVIPETLKTIIEEETAHGLRVITLAKTDDEIDGDRVDLKNLTPVAVIILEDSVRPEAIQTIKWFRENDVKIKVISGDDPVTVGRISERVGVENFDEYVSLADMSDEEVIDSASKYTVFGRVSPEQKALLIKTFKRQGATVAMTGDGVNDVLAMKEADCSITFAAGSSATRSLAHIVLMNNDFNCIPSVVCEGRRVINNIERSSALYLMKTVFVTLLAIASIILGSVYPLTTGYMLALEMIIIGLASTALSVQPNRERVKGRFINTVLTNALPGSLILILNFVAAKYAHLIVDTTGIETTMTVMAITFGGLAFLSTLIYPYDTFRLVMFGFIAVVLVLWAAFLSGTPSFGLPQMKFPENAGAVIFLAVLFILDLPIIVSFKKLLKLVLSVK